MSGISASTTANFEKRSICKDFILSNNDFPDFLRRTTHLILTPGISCLNVYTISIA